MMMIIISLFSFLYVYYALVVRTGANFVVGH
jgi:hypothetical protein